MNAVDGCTSFESSHLDLQLRHSAFDELTYQSIFVIAESCRVSRPPRIRMSLQCLLSVFGLDPPLQIQLQTHMQVGSLLMRYTRNTQLAQLHLQAAFTLAKPLNGPIYFECASLLADTLCKLYQPSRAKPLLRDAITSSQSNPYWHARLLLQLARIHHEEGDHMSTRQLLDVGAELASGCGSDYLRILFLLSKGMVLLIEENLEEVNAVLTLCGQLIDNIKDTYPVQAESHKVYFLTLQVAHLLSGGQVKSVKTSLKQLQQSVQEITALPLSTYDPTYSDSVNMKEADEAKTVLKLLSNIDCLSWLPRDQMCILVYLVTVTYSLLAGYLDKAHKYTEKALKQIKRLKSSGVNDGLLLVRLEMMFLEHMAQYYLVMCDRKAAFLKIMEGCRLCAGYPTVPSITGHATQMHTLLGMYCISMNYLEIAEQHLQLAVKTSKNSDQLLTNLLNLAVVYMHNYQQCGGRISQSEHRELIQILNQINPDSSAVRSRSLKAASFFVKGMFSFFQSSYNDAKRFLRETLKMANAQDLNRLTACALVLLGHIYLSVGNHQESVNMVLPAMHLAGKIPDMCVKLWASALLCDLYRLCGDEVQFAEYRKMYESLASLLLSDRYDHSGSGRHKILQWLQVGPPPPSAFTDVLFHSSERKQSESPIVENSAILGISSSVGSMCWNSRPSYSQINTENMDLFASTMISQGGVCTIALQGSTQPMNITDKPECSSLNITSKKMEIRPGKFPDMSQTDAKFPCQDHYFYPLLDQDISHVVTNRLEESTLSSIFSVRPSPSFSQSVSPVSTQLSQGLIVAHQAFANAVTGSSSHQIPSVGESCDAFMTKHPHGLVSTDKIQTNRSDAEGGPVESFVNPLQDMQRQVPVRQLFDQSVEDNLQIFRGRQASLVSQQQAWSTAGNQFYDPTSSVYPWS